MKLKLRHTRGVIQYKNILYSTDARQKIVVRVWRANEEALNLGERRAKLNFYGTVQTFREKALEVDKSTDTSGAGTFILQTKN